MWKYIRQYLPYAILAGLFMIGEVSMDLAQPGIMSQIVDDGVLGLNSSGVSDLTLILKLGLIMIGLVLFGGLCGSLNNVFVHMSGQNIAMKSARTVSADHDLFFSQMDAYGAGSLVTRVTMTLPRSKPLCLSLSGHDPHLLLMFGSMFCMFRLNRQFGFIVLCAFPVIVGCLTFCMFKANPLFSKLQAQLDDLNGIMQEDVANIRIIKACVGKSMKSSVLAKPMMPSLKPSLKSL